MKKLKYDLGFTLIEVLCVIAIIAILCAVAIPTYFASVNKAKEAVDAANLHTAQTVGTVAYIDGDADPGTYLFDGSDQLLAADAQLKGYGSVDHDKVIQVVIDEDGRASCFWVDETDAT